MPDKSVEPTVNLELRTQPGSETVVLHCADQIVAGDTSQALKSAVVDLLHRHHDLWLVLVELIFDRNGLETLVSLYSFGRTAKASVKFENLTTAVSDSRTRSSHLQQLAG